MRLAVCTDTSRNGFAWVVTIIIVFTFKPSLSVSAFTGMLYISQRKVEQATWCWNQFWGVTYTCTCWPTEFAPKRSGWDLHQAASSRRVWNKLPWWPMMRSKSSLVDCRQWSRQAGQPIFLVSCYPDQLNCLGSFAAWMLDHTLYSVMYPGFKFWGSSGPLFEKYGGSLQKEEARNLYTIGTVSSSW